MLRATTTALLVVAALGGATQAKAPLCRQITDAPGDGHPFAPVVPSDDALDVVSADVATGPHHVVAAIRLKSLAPGQALTGSGLSYVLQWSVDGTPRRVSYTVTSGGDRRATFTGRDGVGHEVQYRTDPATATITVTVPRRFDPDLRRKGVLHLGSVTSAAGPAWGSTSAAVTADTASANRDYVDGTPTCLRDT